MFGWSRGGGGIRSDWYDADSAMDLDFVNGRYFDGSRSYSTFDAWAAAAAATFTRESVALTRDAAGKFVAVASGVPRLDYNDGLLITGVQGNKITAQKYLVDITTGFSGNVPTIVDDTVALTAAGLLGLTIDGNVFEYNNTTGSVVYVAFPGTTGNIAEHSVAVMMRVLSGTAAVRLTPTDNSAVSNSEYVLLRYDAMSPNSTAAQVSIKVSAMSRARFFLPSLEQRSFAGLYPAINNAEAATTKPAEIFTQAAAGQPVGSVTIRAKAARDTIGTQTLWQWDDDTANNRLSIYRDSSGDLRCVSISGGVEQANINAGAVADSELFQVTFSWKADDFKADLNGTVGTDTSGDVPTGLTTIRRGSNSAGANAWEGHIQSEKMLLTLTQYVSQDGDDSWSGLTVDEPKATLAAAIADLSAGGTLWLKAGEVWELGSALVSDRRLTVRRYGTGSNPEISSTSTVTPGAWTPDPTHANVKYADVSHAVPMPVSATPTNTIYPALYAEIDGEWVSLFWVKDAADIAATRATVAATPLSFTVHVQDSSEPDPQDEAAGDYSDFRYYVNLDGVDPATIGMHHAEWHRAIDLPAGTILRGISWGRTAEKDGCTLGLDSEHHDCEAIDMPIHAGVGLVRRISNFTATGRAVSNPVGAWVWYRANSGAAPAPLDAVVDGFAIDNMQAGFYAHGSGGEFAVINSLTVKNGTAANGIYIMRHSSGEDSVAAPSLIENVVATDMTHIGRIGNTTVRDVTWTSKEAGSSEGVLMTGDVTIEDSTLTFLGTGNKLFVNDRARVLDSEDAFTLTLDGATIVGDPDQPSAGREGQVVVVE